MGYHFNSRALPWSTCIFIPVKMALLQYKALVNYEAQLDAFQSFLEKFESSRTTAQDEAAEAIDGLHLDGDNTSDEYDFMDDVADRDGAAARHRTKRKYMEMLQEVADRERSDVLIELDDLQEVCMPCPCDRVVLTEPTV